MRLIHAVAAAVAATGIVGSVAQATLTVSLVPVPISAAAVTADSALNTSSTGARSYDIDVTQAGEKWNVADVQITLASTGGLSGSFYTPTGHNNIYQPSPVTANLAYDTSVSTPMWESSADGTQIDVLGASDYPAPAAPGAPAVISGNTFNVSWGDKRGDLNTTTDGTYRVARITVLGNTGAYFSGYFAGTSGNTQQAFSNVYVPILGDTNGDGAVNFTDFVNVKNNFNGSGLGDTNGDGVVNFTDFVNVKNNFNNSLVAGPGASLGALVPEPTSLALLAVAGLAGLARSRRSI